MTIILNLKKLVFKIYFEEEKMLEIDVQGEGIVIVVDIIYDSDVEILNLDLYIVMLVKDVYFCVCLIVKCGCGYMLVDVNKSED